MLDHVSITARDLSAAEVFHEAAEQAERSFMSIRLGGFSAIEPGPHWYFKAQTPAAGDAFWRTGLAHGVTVKGAPARLEPHPSYCAFFLIDPAGNRVEAVYQQQSPSESQGSSPHMRT